MEEKFYISKSYKLSILFLLIFVSYGPMTVLLKGQWSMYLLISILFVLILWFINLNFWMNPVIILTDLEIIIRPTPYYRKKILLSEIKSTQSLGNGSIQIMFNDKDSIKKQILLPINDQQKLIDLIKSKIVQPTPDVEFSQKLNV